MLSISFEVDVPTGKVGGSLLFEYRRCELPWGVWGHAPPENVEICYFQRSPDSVWALRTIKIMLYKPLIFYVYYSRSFNQNLNHWLLEKSEMINLQMLIQKNTFIVLSSCCPFEKTCSAMSALVFFGADAILANAKAWDLVL